MVSIAGLGGLLYGYDLGIIGTALLYLDKCVRLSEHQVGLLASAVMMGALASSVIGGVFSDLLGRKKAMIASALLFAVSVIMIITAHGFWPLFFGRTLQGLSAGMIAVIIPVYMSECVPAKIRGLGATVFQLCITLGILLAMGAGAYFQSGVADAVAAAAGDNARTIAIQDAAWRDMFRSSIWPAVVFFIVALLVSESPRWLFRRGRKSKAREVLAKGRDAAQVDLEMGEMEAAAKATNAPGDSSAGGSIFERRYMLPLVLAVVLLGINQATGIVAVLTFPVVMLNQSGLSEEAASHTGVWLALTNFVVTIFGVLLVDRLGRKALLKIGTGLMIVALAVGIVTFRRVESARTDVSEILRSAIVGNTLELPVASIQPQVTGPVQVNVVYAYDGAEQMLLVRSDSRSPILRLNPDENSPRAALTIRRAVFHPAPDRGTGAVIFGCLLIYIAGFAFGPGVCLWLMSAELLPTRVRSMGMGIGVLFNALTTIGTTSMFLPVVGSHGYSVMWGVWLLCTLAYLLFAAFVLPETKGKTLEEIEALFRRDSAALPVPKANEAKST